MRLFTKDTDGKPDTPFSVWIGLAFIAWGLGMQSAKIGPGELGLSWELGMNMFFILVGLTALIPGLFLTLLRRPQS